MKKILFAFLLTLGGIFSLQAAIEVHEFDSPEHEQLFKELGKELRCPKCQNNNIADSNAALAEDLRSKVYEMLKEGKSKQEILDYMTARYGNFVTYAPPLTASTLILWVLPAAFFLIGFIMLFRISKKKSEKQLALSSEEQTRLAALLGDELGEEKLIEKNKTRGEDHKQ